MAIATPQALEVPTARTGRTPRQTSNGTVMLPPPMPTTAESAPMPPPAAVIGHPRGGATSLPSAGARVLPNPICHAATRQYTATTQRSTVSSSATARPLPSQPPSSSPGTIHATVGHSTLPRFACERAEDRPVRTMLASELARAACIAASCGTPNSGSIHASAAMITRPPPMPSRPASRPAARPSKGNPRYIQIDTACSTAGARAVARRVANAQPPRHGHSGALRIFERMLHSPTIPLLNRPSIRIRAPRRLAPLLLALAAFCTQAHAQSVPDPSTDAAVAAAIAAAQRGEPVAATAALRADPRWPWIEYARLARDLDKADGAEVRAFLQRYDGQAVASSLRPLWLASLSRRKQWNDLLADWRPVEDVGLRCARLNALHELGRHGPDWNSQAQAIWRKGESLPDACDPVFTALSQRGGLDTALRWERFDLAVEAGQAGVMRAIARGLPEAERKLAEDYVGFLQAPHGRALQWPRDARSRKVAAAGLAALARNDPDAAERQLAQLGPALQLGEAERGKVLYQVALWTVASYLPDSAR